MSELIEQSRAADIRRQLLVTASALALTAYIATTDAAKAEDSRPTVWIELGGQMEQVQGNSAPFSAPFMTALSPTPDVYANNIFLDTQRAARMAFGLEGAAVFRPESSEWKFSANLLFGRSSTNRHMHQQGAAAPAYHSGYAVLGWGNAPFADSKSAYDESHTILDFSVGKDVGLGALGRDGTSAFAVGIRFAQFSNRSKFEARGRPEINFGFAGMNRDAVSFYNYTMFAEAARSFRGVGPSLSWNASAALLGIKDAGELTLDWGINGALLFGRQKAKTHHATTAYHMPITHYYAGLYDGYYYSRVYSTSHHQTRSRRVTVPNLGGFAGISVRYPNVKFSLGYRADFFFGAVDAGIDQRHTKNLGFNGPFATFSVGLGG